MLRHPEPRHDARQSDGHDGDDGERQDSYAVTGVTALWLARHSRLRLRRPVGRGRIWRITPIGVLLASVVSGLIVVSGVSSVSGLSGVSW